MEREHTNMTHEHVSKNHEDGTPLLDGRNRDDVISSPIPPPATSPPRTEENLSSASHDPSQMKSPSIQTMGQAPPAGYDPNRIPTSIFSTKPTNPTEWSVASNESLFSIHMGNNSFSRDYTILFGKSGDIQDFHASQHGELPRLDERTNNNSNNNNNLQSKPNELISLPPVMESPPHEESHFNREKSPKLGPVSSSEKHDMPENEVVANVVPDARKCVRVEPDLSSSSSTLEKYEKEKPVHDEVVNIRTDVRKAMPAERIPSNPQTFPSPPRFSNESGNSGSSFAFPVLLSHENGKPESLKVVPEKPEPPAQVSNGTSNASETRWFSFFLCWPRCC
ncbi:hypothetical protein OROGR_023566 [Orobanche gracilis]